jgi:hypothetical protein
MLAVWWRNTAAVKMLMAAGADIHVLDLVSG